MSDVNSVASSTASSTANSTGDLAEDMIKDTTDGINKSLKMALGTLDGVDMKYVSPDQDK